MKNKKLLKKISILLPAIVLLGIGAHNANAAFWNWGNSSTTGTSTKMINKAMPRGRGHGMREGEHMGPKGPQQGPMFAIRTAISNNDFNAFSSSTKGTALEGKVDATAFSHIVEAFNYMNLLHPKLATSTKSN